MMDTTKLETDTLAILCREHPAYGWWASMHMRDGMLWVSLQASRLGVKESMGYGADPHSQTAEYIASNLSNLLYHLDEKTVPIIRALKEAGELRPDYSEYCYQTQEWIDEMSRLQNAGMERYFASLSRDSAKPPHPASGS